MKFANVQLLHLLWLLIPLGWLLMRCVYRKQRKLQALVQKELIPRVAPHFRWSREKQRVYWLSAVAALSFVALSRPQWGFEWQQVKKQGLDILVVVDVSKSMLTQDVKPNRLQRTKLAIRDLVKKLKGDRIGLVAFAGDAFLFCPLTVDYSGFLLSLQDLDVDTVSRGGTNLSLAIREAVKGYGEVPSKYKAIIIVSDGDNLEGDPLAAARQAKAQGIKVYSIGIGTRGGELIQVVNEEGETEYLRDPDGNFVKSRLNEGLLKKIALTTGGAYVKASGAQFGLDLIYTQELSQWARREIKAEKTKKYYERFQWPLFFALVFLLAETLGPLSSKKQE
jgi:Ca-activated chloride channel family protein